MRISTVLVVAAYSVPGHHQVGMAVYQLVVGHPQGVAHTLHALEVVHVTGRHHKLDVDGLCHLAHGLGNGFLVVVAVAAQVVGDVEVERLFQSLPLLGAVLPCGGGHTHGSVAGHRCQGQYRSGGKGQKIDSFHKAVFVLLILPVLIILQMLRTMPLRQERYRSGRLPRGRMFRNKADGHRRCKSSKRRGQESRLQDGSPSCH